MRVLHGHLQDSKGLWTLSIYRQIDIGLCGVLHLYGYMLWQAPYHALQQGTRGILRYIS